MNFNEYPDRDLMMIDVANHLAGEINAQIMVNDRASFAVPGGTTPGPIFDVLCAADLDWSKVTVLPTDERWVPEDSEHSNARLIREHLLTGRAAVAGFFSFYRDGRAPEECLEALTAELEAHLPISVLVLGMGGDMHTASLFPADAMTVTGRGPGDEPLFQAVDVPAQGALSRRVSLTAEALNGAMSKHILITGADKRAALERAREIDDPEVAPVSAVLSGAEVHWAE